jgi:hypothetical protein
MPVIKRLGKKTSEPKGTSLDESSTGSTTGGSKSKKAGPPKALAEFGSAKFDFNAMEKVKMFSVFHHRVAIVLWRRPQRELIPTPTAF